MNKTNNQHNNIRDVCVAGFDGFNLSIAWQLHLCAAL